MTIFLVNPPREATVAKGRRKDGTLKRGFTISKKSGRVVKAGGSGRRSRRSSRRRDSKGRFLPKRGRKNPTGRRKMARKLPPRDSKGRFVKSRSRSRSRKRRSYKRNPPGMFGDVLGHATEGAVDALGVVGGEAAARQIPRYFGVGGGAMGMAAQAATAIVVGELARRFLGDDVGRMVTAGGLAAPLKDVVVSSGVPVLSGALSAYPMIGRLEAYPQLLPSGSGMAAYPELDYGYAYS